MDKDNLTSDIMILGGEESGIDSLTSDIMILGGEESVKQITTIFNQML